MGLNMSLPTDRKYTASHEWVKADGDVFQVGITDDAQDQLGDLVFVGDVNTGAALSAGDTAGVVESVKAASDIYAPVDGEIVAFNEQLESQPDLVNQAAFDTWIFKIRPNNAADVDGLMDAAAAEAQDD
jgi:glycine cleavage system H protein